MSDATLPVSDIRLRLQRLAKGALFVGIAAGYTLLLAWTLVFHSWKPALLALFFIVVGQFFRHIASEADRLGWRLNADGANTADADPTTRTYQKRMLWLFASLTQLPNIALVAQAWHLSALPWAATMAGALAIIELLYLLIRHLNRQTAFQEASYGFKDRTPLTGGPATIDESRQQREAEVERKLEELRHLMEAGRISPKAYKKACDRHRVRMVMAKDVL